MAKKREDGKGMKTRKQYVSCTYCCCEGHKVLSWHPSMLSSFPSLCLFQILFCLFHKSGFTKDTRHLVQKLVDKGVSYL